MIYVNFPLSWYLSAGLFCY